MPQSASIEYSLEFIIIIFFFFFKFNFLLTLQKGTNSRFSRNLQDVAEYLANQILHLERLSDQ